ncbi:hypothetical protein ATCC90586_001491 [Pythium insidiosum]|nr:hypothetical protein ATCC90586_001491 [Pythium insidiosum]
MVMPFDRTTLVLATVLSIAWLEGARAAATPLLVHTVYDSENCGGKVVQNNYMVAPSGRCEPRKTCMPWAGDSAHGYQVGCCTSDASSTSASTNATFGPGVNTVTWFIYNDIKCETFLVASDSQMTMSLETARCNPQTDKTSKQFTYSVASKSITSSHFASKDCTGTPINSTISMSDMGKCIPLGSIGLSAYATIDGVTYGLPAGTPKGAAPQCMRSFLASAAALVAALIDERNMESPAERLARLQATLRAIERGERLEAVDSLLVRQVLGRTAPKRRQTRAPTRAETPPDATVRVDGKDAYRVLQQLRRQRKSDQCQATRPTPVPLPPSPPRSRSPQKPGTKSPDRQSRQRSPLKEAEHAARNDADEERRREDQVLARESPLTAAVRRELNKALSDTEQALDASQRDARIAAEDMEKLLAASQSVLSSQFLFERNLTAFCQERSLTVIQRALQRFQHRFYREYFAQWQKLVQRRARLWRLERQLQQLKAALIQNMYEMG